MLAVEGVRNNGERGSVVIVLLFPSQVVASENRVQGQGLLVKMLHRENLARRRQPLPETQQLRGKVQ